MVNLILKMNELTLEIYPFIIKKMTFRAQRRMKLVEWSNG